MPEIQQIIEGDMRNTASRGTDRNFTMNGKRRFRRTGALAVLWTTVALGAVACGSGDDAGKAVASVPGSASTTAQAAGSTEGDPLAFAQCMRENGLPDFPDPKPGQGISMKPGSSLDPTSAQFKAAESRCKQYAPANPVTGGPEDQWSSADKLKFAQCMRENGVSTFPDPGSDGSLPPIIQGGDMDPESPQFKAAEKACAQYQPQNIPKQGPGSGS
jgi:hypothetical protein